MLKLKKYAFDIINFIGAVLFLWIISLLLWGEKMNYICKRIFAANNIVLILSGIVTLAMLILLFNSCQIKIRKYLFIVGGIFFLLQIYISYNIFFETGWDSGWVIIPTARQLVNNGSISSVEYLIDYYITYPNNKLMTLIYYIILKINSMFGIFTGGYELMSIVVINCLISSLVCWMIFKLAEKILGKKAVLIYFVSLILIGLSPWMVICYSDAMALLFPILTIYIYGNKKLKTVPRYVLILFIGYLGYCIKPQAFIVVIAIVINEMLKVLTDTTKEKIKKGLRVIVFSILFVFLISTVLNSVYTKLGFQENKEKSLGWSHFFMMGLNQETGGIWSADDVEASKAFESNEDRKEYNLSVAELRIKEMGVKGYIEFLSKKMMTNYNDGTFAWGTEGEFYFKIPEEANTWMAPRLRSVFYADGYHYLFFATVEQMIWLVIILGCFGNMLIRLITRTSEDENNIMTLAIIGLTVFEILFEPRARYLYLYTPIYILIFCQTIKKVDDKLCWNLPK